MTFDTSTWVQIIAGTATLITAIGALISSLRTNRKVKQSEESKKREAADAAQVIVDAAADQVQVIRDEAARIRDKLREEQAESDKWKNQCELLEGKYNTLSSRVEAAETCQSDLTDKIKKLEQEKKSLMDRVAKLTEQVEALQEENRRLKQEKETEKLIIA